MTKRDRGLNDRQRKFAEAYAASGNAKHAARVAGYTGTDHVLEVTGSRLLSHAEVSSAIAEFSRKRTRAIVATRERRLEFLSRLVEGEVLAPIGVANGKPVFGPPSHDARRRAAMDIARMNGELLDKAPVEVTVNARSVHVVLAIPPSPHGPKPDAPPTLEATLDATLDAKVEKPGGDDGRS